MNEEMNKERIIKRLNSIRTALWSIVGLLHVIIGIGAAIGGVLFALL